MVAGGDNVSIAKAIETCGKRRNTLEYLEKTHTASVKKNRTEAQSTLATKAIGDNLATAVYAEGKVEALSSKLHDGSITEDELTMLQPGYFNDQDSVAEKSWQALDESSREKLRHVTIVYHVDADAGFSFGCKSDGKSLDPKKPEDKKVIDQVEQFVHSWLRTNQMSSKHDPITQRSIIYRADQVDSNGNFINKADPSTISRLLQDPAKGLEATIKKQDTSVTAEVRAYVPSSPANAARAAPPTAG